ncbi:endonuclease/exonuclease/phosphatase family protein [Parahaliea sp. F7430]|uniref:Endonuclease/exonuclease/phosphatase family protein n=1 Tax=Sediminihaliea albiluteola TaxID=2758564 RepID=A0A7W2YJY2_9GAMM|nr:exodeoxyribonuclease III [Sediminihaliea albiluteola]MBA6413587.1 endonuclease/exonuclease/phosphatase family protein [Sediminihaliea albiluteola]
MRIISFSADGIKNAAKRGFYDWLSEQDADFVCIQNLQCSEYDLQDSVYFPPEYNAYFFDDVNGKANGVAIYCRQLPKAIMTGLGFADFDMEGRYIQADYENLSVGCLLAPSAETGNAEQLARKAEFYQLLQGHLFKIRNKRREFIICGDWQFAHTAADVQDTERNSTQSGFLAEERQWMDELIEGGYVDAFREVNSDNDEFSWWPDGERGSNGWRSDFHIVSKGLKYNVDYGVIYKAREFGNHAPVIMDYDIELS